MDIEEKVKTKLLIRGFSKENLLNNRGLIGATTDETILEVVKNLGIANVSNQRELLRSYNKFINEECLLGGGILSDFEIEKFEERNCG